MANTTDTSNGWVKIQQGVKETERLIGQRQYNLSMVKARQTLEFMVKCLSERAGLIDSDLIDSIDELYEGKWISKATCEHYHTIRMLGNKAVHDGDSSAYNANQAYHLLSQEVYTFSNDYSSRKHRSAAGRRQQSRRSGRSSGQKREQSPAFYPHDIFKILLPVLVIILLIAIIRSCTASGEKKVPETTAAPETTAVAVTAPVSPVIETTAEETTQAPVYRTTTSLRVRSQPSTDASVLTVLAAGSQVDYVGQYDEQWSIIMYNGTEAYVSQEYLETE